MPHAQDREELGRCLPTFPPTFRRGRHRARRSRAAGLPDAHPAPAANQETPVGFRTEQITNAYRVHEPTRGLGLLAMAVFATGSNSWTASVSKFSSEESKDDFERMRRGVGPRNTAEGLSS